MIPYFRPDSQNVYPIVYISDQKGKIYTVPYFRLETLQNDTPGVGGLGMKTTFPILSRRHRYLKGVILF